MKRGVLAAITVLIAFCSPLMEGRAAAQPLSTGPASQQSPTPPECGTSFNPYDYTQAALQTCGISTFPLSNVTSLPGGGESYNYPLGNGDTVRLVVPPTGFDPATATDGQLSEYQFPPRPTSSVALAGWDKNEANMQAAPPPPFLAEASGGQFTYSNANSHWSGWGVPTDHDVVTNVTVTWTEPSIINTCTSDSVGEWAGLGDFDPSTWPNTTGKLAQDGTAIHFGGLDNHQAWFTVLPVFTKAMALSVTGNPGDSILAYVKWDSSNTWFAGNVQDISNDEQMGWIVNAPASDYEGDSAEAIAERPAGYNHLSDFETLHFTSAAFNGNTSFSDTTWPVDKIHLTSDGTGNGTLLASIGSLGGSGAFDEMWQACG